MKKIYILTTILLLSQFAKAEDAFTVSTFHCISVYWSPEGGATDKEVSVEFSVTGMEQWKDALPLIYNPISGAGTNPETGQRYDKADYRGSIVNLVPGETYDIRLTLEGTSTTTTISATTWAEEFPIGETINVGNRNSEYAVRKSGTADGYLLIDGKGATIDVANRYGQCIYLDNVEYVIIRGFTLKNAKTAGVMLKKCKHIIIEDCDISEWGSKNNHNDFGVNFHSGIMGYYDNDAVSCVFQRNKIHHPNYGSNSWAELNGSSYHPSGPQGISFAYCEVGNNVIRYNEIWSSEGYYFNDVMGYGPNASYNGFPGADSDIYGNYLANSWDDGIEAEGSNANVRIWNNFIEENYLTIANAATSVGPLYIWKNIAGRNYSPPGSEYGQSGPFIKFGYASAESWMTGHMYVFNNTILQPNGEGAGGFGTNGSGNGRIIKHCVSRNNIINVNSSTTNSISKYSSNSDIDYDYDLLNKSYPSGHELNGKTGTPVYAEGSPVFDFATKTGNFKLSTSSLGYDAGTTIPNFCTTYSGSAPDMGAHEDGTDAMVFGVIASGLTPKITYTLTLRTEGSGSISPAGGTFFEGTEVTLTAKPSSGYSFSHWSGDVSGTTNPQIITVDNDMSVMANFIEDNVSISDEYYGFIKNYPNPFSTETIFEYRIYNKAKVQLVIYNSLGQLVTMLINENQDVNTYKVVWNGTDSSGNKLNNGIYTYQFSVDNKVITQNIILTK